MANKHEWFYICSTHVFLCLLPDLNFLLFVKTVYSKIISDLYLNLDLEPPLELVYYLSPVTLSLLIATLKCYSLMQSLPFYSKWQIRFNLVCRVYSARAISSITYKRQSEINLLLLTSAGDTDTHSGIVVWCGIHTVLPLHRSTEKFVHLR